MPNEHAQIFVVLAATAVIVLILVGILVFVLLFYQRQHFLFKEQLNESSHAHELLTTKMEMQEQTLQLIGEELHDNIGQLLSSAKMFLALSEQSIEKVPPPFVTATNTLSHAIKELRALSKSFSTEWLNQFNLLENVQREVERINSANGIGITLEAPSSTLPLRAETQIMVFRVIQEAIQNSIKHAQPKNLSIKFLNDDHHLRISVVDDGIGFNVLEGSAEGVGRLHMRHRAELLKGTIEWHSQPGTGTGVHIVIPFSGN